MNYTQNYQLPQWVETDRILMEDFNGAFSALDTALAAHDGDLAEKGNCQFCTVSYVGTGMVSITGTPVLTFPFQPELVVITGGKDGVMVMHQNAGNALAITSSGTWYNVVDWEEKQVSWYYHTDGAGEAQMNASGTHYLVVALAAAGGQ